MILVETVGAARRSVTPRNPPNPAVDGKCRSQRTSQRAPIVSLDPSTAQLPRMMRAAAAGTVVRPASVPRGRPAREDPGPEIDTNIRTITHIPEDPLPQGGSGTIQFDPLRDFRATKLGESEGSKTGSGNGHKMPSFRTGARTAGSDTPLATGLRTALLEELVVAGLPSDLLLLQGFGYMISMLTRPMDRVVGGGPSASSSVCRARNFAGTGVSSRSYCSLLIK
jgi:hypothetical protein